MYLKWILHEIKLQWKNGLYMVYLLINFLYILLLGYTPTPYKELVTTLLLLSDPTFLGMIFVGGILLLEKNQGIPKGIGISPLGGIGYLIGKIVSLLVIALLTAGCMMLVGGVAITFYRVAAIMVSASLFTLLGILIGCFSKGINHFIFLIVVGTLPFAIPVLGYLFELNLVWANWIPIHATVQVLTGHTYSMLYLGYLGIWLVGVFILTKKIVERELFVR
jgi:fluoroquinolone transport system permease protein